MWLITLIGRPGRVTTVPKLYPQEFRDDVVRVARAREAGITLAQIAKGFGIHERTLNTWTRQADINDGNRPGTRRAELAADGIPVSMSLRSLAQLARRTAPSSPTLTHRP